MPARHCSHCWGDCPGNCLLPGLAGEQGLCIHQPVPSRTLRERLRLLQTGRFWRRLIIR
jgi:hypothetical protein